MMYQCVKCKFRIVPKTSKVPSRCPNCGVAGSLVQEMKAADILKNVDEMF